MRVFTPVEIAEHAANKYLGVLVAAKYARALNEFRRLRVARQEAHGLSLEAGEATSITASSPPSHLRVIGQAARSSRGLTSRHP
jgi:hypothetical protein